MKQVIIIRSDLNLPKGKLCSQVAHASVSAALQTRKKDPKKLKKWLSQGGKKIILQIKGLKKLKSLYQEATTKGLTTSLVKDKGLTVVNPGTITCVGIGPNHSHQIDEITRDLNTL